MEAPGSLGKLLKNYFLPSGKLHNLIYIFQIFNKKYNII